VRASAPISLTQRSITHDIRKRSSRRPSFSVWRPRTRGRWEALERWDGSIIGVRYHARGAYVAFERVRKAYIVVKLIARGEGEDLEYVPDDINNLQASEWNRLPETPPAGEDE
jgi:hypothetical protein